jgi:hypothetical protein
LPTPIAEFGFEFESGANEAVVYGPAFGRAEITGFFTVTTFVDGVEGMTMSSWFRGANDAQLCIDPATSEDCDIQCKEELLGHRILQISENKKAFEPATYVIQNEDMTGCAEGEADQSSPTNDGRQGLVHSTILSIGKSLPTGSFLVMPFKLSLEVPPFGGENTFELVYEDSMQGTSSYLFANNVSIDFSNVTGEPDEEGRFITTVPATSRVRPLPFVTELHMTGDHQITGKPGEPATGSTSIVIFSLGDNGDGGIAGFQYSLGYSDEIRVTSASLSEHLMNSLPGVSRPDFTSSTFSPNGVDPNEIYVSEEPADPDCEISPGEPQGNGITVGVTFDLLSAGSATLPTSGTFGTMEIQYEQTVPFLTSDDEPQTARFEWRDCLGSNASRVKTGFTVRGRTIHPASRVATTPRAIPPASGCSTGSRTVTSI